MDRNISDGYVPDEYKIRKTLMLDQSENKYMDSESTGVNRSAQRKTESSSVVIESSALFAGLNQVLISHAGEVYRLRITKNGKLILNK
jgi:hemin uptake protein HemP